MSDKKTIQQEANPTSEIEQLNPEQQVKLDEMLAFMKSDDFHGFACCGHSHDEPGVLWNDSGHRTQIERAILILTTLEPGSEFLSLWSLKPFRDGFYKGLWQADYEDPWYNYFSIAFSPIYTSHFYNPEKRTHFGNHLEHLTGLRNHVTAWNENAYTRVTSQHYEAAKLHDSWKDAPTDSKLIEMGRLLGISTHYFTDLTQPMHTANFTNYYGFEGYGVLNPIDERHQVFETLADTVLNDFHHKNRVDLLCNPGTVKTDFTNNLDELITKTAQHSLSVFKSKMYDLMVKLGKELRFKGPIHLEEALPAFKDAFPAGQIATAKFFQQWARQSHDQNPSKRLWSDLVSVTVRKDASKTFQPALFYRRDGDLCPIFRYLDQGVWREDSVTFAEFAGHSANITTAFSSCYDVATDHPVLFITNEQGKLFYFDNQGGWKKTEIVIPEKVRGSIVSVYDEHYSKPCAIYRGESGTLHYVYWKNNAFVVSVLSDFPKVGGAISVVWDPTPCGPENKGHIAISYIGGNGLVHHLNVRDNGWKHMSINYIQIGTHADAQTLASVYDTREKKVGLFWGFVEYIEKPVPESPKLKFVERQSPKILYTVLHSNPVTTDLKVKSVGGIAAIGGVNPTVYFISEHDAGVTLERFGANWVRYISKDKPVGMFATYIAPDKSVVVGSRLKDRTTQLYHYKTPTLKTGDLISLKAENNRYLSRINHGKTDPIEATKLTVDHFSTFLVTILDGHTLTLKADAGLGKYLSRINYGHNNVIEAIRDVVDPHTKFKFAFSAMGAIYFMADNGSFLSNNALINSTLVANNNQMNYNSVFTVSILK